MVGSAKNHRRIIINSRKFEKVIHKLNRIHLDESISK